MSQLFQLIAPQAKKALPSKNMLGDMLFDGSPKKLVRLLAVPILPSAVSLAQSQNEGCSLVD